MLVDPLSTKHIPPPCYAARPMQALKTQHRRLRTHANRTHMALHGHACRRHPYVRNTHDTRASSSSTHTREQAPPRARAPHRALHALHRGPHADQSDKTPPVGGSSVWYLGMADDTKAHVTTTCRHSSRHVAHRAHGEASSTSGTELMHRSCVRHAVTSVR